MTNREIFRRTLRFEDAPRLPRVEWAAWWDKTYNRWTSEGLPAMGFLEGQAYFGLDPMLCWNFSPSEKPIATQDDYDRVRAHLFRDEIGEGCLAWARQNRAMHDRGDTLIRMQINGFFWYPRTLFGIEPHLYAFYDEPELMHRICADLLAFYRKWLPPVFKELTPDMLAFGEDMSYNLGPMLSEDTFNEFLRPYYLPLADMIKSHGIPLFVDSDGLVDRMLPWLTGAGIEGVLPLERQAGCDINKYRAAYPKLLLLGAFDKMVMKHGEEAMRAEFERILPVMRSGGYIPSIDHQTPPDVSLENYRIYARLFREYTERT
ncbi:MAG: hypothetical protein LBR73_08995 [Oscillospiraceae bacterium]|jgi:hypothetical protein|nr:hypothetical protein [Oscillospiraceae bacterium]